jgi:hypothetical protein
MAGIGYPFVMLSERRICWRVCMAAISYPFVILSKRRICWKVCMAAIGYPFVILSERRVCWQVCMAAIGYPFVILSERRICWRWVSTLLAKAETYARPVDVTFLCQQRRSNQKKLPATLRFVKVSDYSVPVLPKRSGGRFVSLPIVPFLL